MRSRSSSERGYFIVLGVAVLFVLLAVVALAVDAGQLYRAHLRLRRALDAGASAASKLIGTADAANAPDIAREIARDNLKSMGYTTAQIVVNASWTPNSHQTGIQLNGRINLNTALIHFMPGVNRLTHVAADAEAVNQRAVIVLVLDYSGSMLQRPAGSGTPTKVERLRDAVHMFLGDTTTPSNYVVAGQDRVGVVMFNTLAWIPSGGGFNGHPSSNFAPFYENFIVGQTAPSAGMTNTQMGLWLARYEIQHNTGLTSAELIAANKAIILITDGAPTMSCSNTISASGSFPSETYNCTQQSANLALNYDRAVLASDAGRTPVVSGDDGIAIYTIGIGKLVGRAGSPPLSAAQLEAADAYQNVNNDSNQLAPYDSALKSNFLRRVANVPPLGNPPTEPVAYFGSGIPNYATYNATTPDPPDGMYLSTVTASDLSDLLAQIGLSIKGRLVH